VLQVMQSSSVYARLGERQGLTDHQAVLTVMLQKIATNLKVYGSSEQLVHLTLALFRVREAVQGRGGGGG
jgi:exportin-7